jgi:hypothetical protein
MLLIARQALLIPRLDPIVHRPRLRQWTGREIPLDETSRPSLPNHVSKRYHLWKRKGLYMLAYLDTLIGFAVVMLGASLVITILTQMISALFSHRGANLRWGLQTMFMHLPDCPLLNKPEYAKMAAKDVLTHSLISDSIFSLRPKWLADRIRLATAIHPDELVAILKDLSTKPAYTTISGLPAEIEKLIEAPNLAGDRRLALLTGTPALAALPIDRAVPLLEDTVSSIQGEAGKLEAWFNATMDRVSARFTTYIRLWTVAFGIALALGTGLNTATLLSGLYTNGAFREAVAGSATQMIDLTSKVLPNGPKDVVGKIYTDAIAKAIADSKATADATPSGIDSENAARAWLTAHVTNSAQQSAALSAFDQALMDQRVQDAADLRTILTKASFDVGQFGWKRGQPYLPQIPGVLITAALLSLGAPFWFNTLKQLSSLRPVLANKQDPPAK